MIFRADVKPGLGTRDQKRKIQQQNVTKQKNIKFKTKPKKVLENENRVSGLQKSISSENKGFALLQKMGYKPGMSIGKTGK